MNWEDEINEHLTNLHPYEIQEGIIKPAITQIIDDYEDSLIIEDEKERIQRTKQIIKKLKEIKRLINKI